MQYGLSRHLMAATIGHGQHIAARQIHAGCRAKLSRRFHVKAQMAEAAQHAAAQK